MATVKLRSRERGIWPLELASQRGVEGYEVVNDYGTFVYPAGCPAPSTSPWGEIQRQKKMARGLSIWWVTTAGHGGYMIERTWARLNLSPQAVAVGRDCPCGNYQHNNRNYLCYEEDCAYAVLEWEAPLLRHAFRRQRQTARPAQDYLLSIFSCLIAWNYNYLLASGYYTDTLLPTQLLADEHSIGLDTRLWGLLYHLHSEAYEQNHYQLVENFARWERGEYTIVASKLPGPSQRDAARFRISLYNEDGLISYRDVCRDDLGSVIGEEMSFIASPQLLLVEAVPLSVENNHNYVEERVS